MRTNSFKPICVLRIFSRVCTFWPIFLKLNECFVNPWQINTFQYAYYAYIVYKQPIMYFQHLWAQRICRKWKIIIFNYSKHGRYISVIFFFPLSLSWRSVLIIYLACVLMKMRATWINWLDNIDRVKKKILNKFFITPKVPKNNNEFFHECSIAGHSTQKFVIN